MKNLSFLFFLIVFVIASCKKKAESNCSAKVCTEEFRSVVLFTQTNGGTPTEVNFIQVKNNRTGKIYNNIQKTTNPINGKIAYVIATDNQVNDFSETGDKLIISITSNNGSMTTEMTIAGGECACHIEKISGAEILIL